MKHKNVFFTMDLARQFVKLDNDWWICGKHNGYINLELFEKWLTNRGYNQKQVERKIEKTK